MRLSGEAYSERLEAFSNFTMVLVTVIHSMSKECVLKSINITSDSDLTEEQLIEKLIETIDADLEQQLPISHESALKIVCEALEEGDFVSLYKSLDKNASLLLVDDNNRVDGIRDVINFLVKERNDHVYCFDKKTITCDMLKVVEGERYGVGETCILLIFHSENGESKHHIVKVQTSDGRINQIKFFHPYGPLHLEAEE